MARFYPQGLLLLFLLIDISACRDDSPVTVYAFQEEDVVLPCAETWIEMDRKSCVRVRLIKYATSVSRMEVILARPKTLNFEDTKRVKWQDDGNGNMSLFLTKPKQSDDGLYGCEVWDSWDCILVKNISLKVKACKTLQAVKAAPSTPVNLNCPVDTTSGQEGPQNISWAMLKGGNPVSVNSKSVQMNVTSLAFQSVIHSDSGWYRCTNYMLGKTQRCFNIKLLVQEVEHVVEATTAPGMTTSENIWKARTEGSSGAFYFVVASVIVGIVIMAALIGVFMYRRRNIQRATQQTQRATQQTQKHPAGTLESNGAYEIVDLTRSEASTNHRVNSLYQQLPEESLCTFQY